MPPRPHRTGTRTRTRTRTRTGTRTRTAPHRTGTGTRAAPTTQRPPNSPSIDSGACPVSVRTSSVTRDTSPDAIDV